MRKQRIQKCLKTTTKLLVQGIHKLQTWLVPHKGWCWMVILSISIYSSPRWINNPNSQIPPNRVLKTIPITLPRTYSNAHHLPLSIPKWITAKRTSKSFDGVFPGSSHAHLLCYNTANNSGSNTENPKCPLECLQTITLVFSLPRTLYLTIYLSFYIDLA